MDYLPLDTLFFSLLLFCAFVAFSQWWVSRSAPLLWYIGYLLATFLHYGRQFWIKIGDKPGFPSIPDPPLEWGSAFSYAAFLCYFMFIRQIMDMETVAPRLSKVLLVISRLLGGMIGLNLLLQICAGDSLAEAVHEGVQLLLFPVMIWIIIRLLRSARLFYQKLILAGTATLVIGFICVIATRQWPNRHYLVPGLICCFPTPWRDICFYHLKVGIILDVLFFSWALTLRQQIMAQQGMVPLSDLPAPSPAIPPVIVLPPYEPPTDEFLLRLHAFLDEKLSDENLTVKRVAAAMHLSKSQLVRMIKKKTGFTTEQYILRHRLHHALYLLLTTQLSIGDITSQVGIKSAAHFSNAFKREFGVSPSEIRRARDDDHTAT